MNPPNPQWNLPDPIPPALDSELSSFPPAFRQVLSNRGIHTGQAAADFLHPEQDIAFADLPGTSAFADRVNLALAQEEQITVYADYDVDGLTSAALLKEALSSIGGQVNIYIPHRIEEGYGLNTAALQALRSQGTDLVITVDCGIRAVTEVKHGQKMGLEFIITDHHHPGGDLPPAQLVINPHFLPQDVITKNLAGVGVAYKCLEALAVSHPALLPKNYLDLVALGTIADVVPLIGENRYLAQAGLDQLRHTRRQGLYSLIMSSGLDPRQVTASDISFQLAPRLNAAGRLAKPALALNLLLSDDPSTCGELAQRLEYENTNRKSFTSQAVQLAERIIFDQEPSPDLLMAAHPDFHQGVVGIAAGRLANKYHRPAIIGKRGQVTTTASCRSISGFDIHGALEECGELLLDYGGHPQAAGFTINNSHLREFKSRLGQLVTSALPAGAGDPVLSIDAVVELAQLNWDLFEHFELMEPSGERNPPPLLLARNIRLLGIKKVGRDRDHLKCRLSDGNHDLPGIGFRLASLADTYQPPVDVLFHFEKNVFRGKTTLQAHIRDLKPSPVE